MPMDRFLIAPYESDSGLTTNLKPWQIADQAWARMDNAYVFRGRVKKRFGSRYMGSNSASTSIDPLTSRLRVSLASGGAGVGITTAGGNATGNVLTITSAANLPLGQGQFFSIGTQYYTVTSALPGVQPMLATSGTATFNLTTGDFVITGSSAHLTNIYFYPALPVMGLTQYEFTAINAYQSFGFDQQFAYTYNNGWERSGTGVTPIWHGNNTNFFWSYNWVGPNSGATALTRALFTSNFYALNPNGAGNATDDPIWYWDNSGWNKYYAYYNPTGGASTGPFVLTARIVVPFHGRLLLLNTIENDGTAGVGAGTNTNYVNRVRYSSEGSPFDVGIFYVVNATDGTKIGKTAGFEDASTLEAIISAEFIKDRLIVYFEESTWELAFTSNEQRPFQWQKLNTELGSMATFSSIAFDKAILTIGETGVHSCNGSNVLRIDDKIPEIIFEVSNPAAETERICGIRDYYSELVYWAVPVDNQREQQPYPSRVLVYNYNNKTWAFNDDCITTWGYYDGQVPETWAVLKGNWDEWNSPWNSGDIENNTRQVIAGNQEGFTFIIDTEASANENVMQVTAMSQTDNGIQLTIIDHMLTENDYIYLTTCPGVTFAGNRIYNVTYIDKDTIIAGYPPEIVESTSPQTLPNFSGTYVGGCYVARVSNYDLYSKQWNPYDNKGLNVSVQKIDFNVTRTPNAIGTDNKPIDGTGGAVTVDYSPSSAPLDFINEALVTADIIGTSALDTSAYALYPLEKIQERIWHPVYLQTQGECIQINIYMSPLQICTPLTAFAQFELNGIILYTQPTGRLE